MALLLTGAAFIILASADLSLWLALPVLPDFMTQLGLALLLSAFVLLLMTGLVMITRLNIKLLRDYFSAHHRAARKLLFIQAQQERLKRLFYFKTVQLNYINQLNKKRLLTRNNRKHIKALSKAIQRDLVALKAQLPTPIYVQLQQENQRYRQQQDSEALLMLQQKISTLV